MFNSQSNNVNSSSASNDATKKSFWFAFTLAEVLITLGIIGVIAALTIPTLIKNYQKNLTVNQLKKVYSQISIAFQPVLHDYNGNIPFTTSAADNEQLIHDEIMSNYKYASYCPYATTPCSACDGYRDMTNYSGTMNAWHPMWSNSHTSRYILPDGTGISFGTSWWAGAPKFAVGDKFTWKGWDDNGVRGNVTIDLNGPKGPNVTGRDIFSLGVSNAGLNFYVTNGEACDTSVQGECLMKIIKDNWEITSDYPWK